MTFDEMQRTLEQRLGVQRELQESQIRQRENNCPIPAFYNDVKIY